MAHVWTTTLEKQSPPTSNSEDNDEGFMSRNLDRGLQIAQLTGSALLTAFNLTETVADTVFGSAFDLLTSTPSNEEDEDVVVEDASPEARGLRDQPTSSEGIPQYQMRDRSRSRDDSEDENMGHRFLEKRSK